MKKKSNENKGERFSRNVLKMERSQNRNDMVCDVYSG